MSLVEKACARTGIARRAKLSMPATSRRNAVVLIYGPTHQPAVTSIRTTTAIDRFRPVVIPGIIVDA